ncbi:MAG: DUF4468 domain-containing protein [Muribaculum sp.]|nr:DUF4468 domain-containing protein [Muribaculum sp.]
MKHLFALATAIFAIIFCQPSASAKDNAPGVLLECDTVIQVADMPAAQIYNNLKTWFANNMRSANNVIQLDDPSNNHIIGKANFDFKVNNMTWSHLTGVINFTIDVAARDGRFRVKLYGFNHESFSNGWTEGPVYWGGPNPDVKGMRKKQNSEMQKRAAPLCFEKISTIISSMTEAMTNPSSAVDDDW